MGENCDLSFSILQLLVPAVNSVSGAGQFLLQNYDSLGHNSVGTDTAFAKKGYRLAQFSLILVQPTVQCLVYSEGYTVPKSAPSPRPKVLGSQAICIRLVRCNACIAMQWGNSEEGLTSGEISCFLHKTNVSLAKVLLTT